MNKFNIVPFAQENAENFAQISAELEKKGDDIGDMDKLIASIVIARDDYLYTRNVTHFKRIPNLRIKNWEFNE